MVGSGRACRGQQAYSVQGCQPLVLLSIIPFRFSWLEVGRALWVVLVIFEFDAVV